MRWPFQKLWCYIHKYDGVINHTTLPRNSDDVSFQHDGSKASILIIFSITGRGASDNPVDSLPSDDIQIEMGVQQRVGINDISTEFEGRAYFKTKQNQPYSGQ